MARWGVQAMVYTNAAGSTHMGLKPADLMMLTDHLNFSGHNPLCGPEDPRMGARFLDMGSAYDSRFQDLLRQTATDQRVDLKQGTYASLLGPSYETPAEVRAYRTLGADAVGMSTVLEVIAAHQMGVRVAAISCITNYGAGVVEGVLSHDEVKETAQQAQAVFTRLLHDGLARMHAEMA
jgi:purine-nucleoside phosphorylase